METFVHWTSLQESGLEQLHLVEDETGIVADSIILGRAQGIPFRFAYQLRIDCDWQVRECFFQTGGKAGQTLQWFTDGQGHWKDATGTAYPELDGCLDIDITETPFTNTLPIRRLALKPGASAEILVAYLSVPDLTFRPVRQRYTCLTRTDTGGHYRFEGMETGNQYELSVDEQALVIDYPGLWHRVE